MTAIVDRNKDVIGKFLAIAESKVSILDEYGDEKWDALPNEIKSCLKKIAAREQMQIDWKKFDDRTAREFRQSLTPEAFASASREIEQRLRDLAGCNNSRT